MAGATGVAVLALRCGAEGVKLLPATLHELTKLVLRQATETAKAQADAPAAGLYDLLSWLRAELPSMLQRLSMLTPLERPPAVEEEEEAAAAAPVDLALARKNALYHKTQRTLEARREQEVSEEEEARRRGLARAGVAGEDDVEAALEEAGVAATLHVRHLRVELGEERLQRPDKARAGAR